MLRNQVQKTFAFANNIYIASLEPKYLEVDKNYIESCEE